MRRMEPNFSSLKKVAIKMSSRGREKVIGAHITSQVSYESVRIVFV